VQSKTEVASHQFNVGDNDFHPPCICRVCLSVVRSVTRYSEEGACEHKQDDAAEKGGDRLRPRCPGGTNLAAAGVRHGVVDER
jgi:hypothetical protein